MEKSMKCMQVWAEKKDSPAEESGCALSGRSVLQELVHDSSEHAAHQRRNDEYPHIAQGSAAGKQGGAEGAGGVHGSAGEVDAQDVDQGQGETDDQACYLAVFRLRSLTGK